MGIKRRFVVILPNIGPWNKLRTLFQGHMKVALSSGQTSHYPEYQRSPMLNFGEGFRILFNLCLDCKYPRSRVRTNTEINLCTNSNSAWWLVQRIKLFALWTTGAWTMKSFSDFGKTGTILNLCNKHWFPVTNFLNKNNIICIALWRQKPAITIERFHSRDPQPYWITETKEGIYIK